jgi:hypothetical protein
MSGWFYPKGTGKVALRKSIKNVISGHVESRHCEERSDEAIRHVAAPNWIASPAMTQVVEA